MSEKLSQLWKFHYKNNLKICEKCQNFENLKKKRLTHLKVGILLQNGGKNFPIGKKFPNFENIKMSKIF